MGSSSRSEQSNTTQNNSLSQAIQGNNNGVVLSGDGNVIDVTTTDAGAFDVIGNMLNQLPNLFSMGGNAVADGFSAVTDVVLMGERQTENAFQTAVDMYGESNNAMIEMSRLSSDVMTEAGEYLSNISSQAIDVVADTVSDTADSAILANQFISSDAMDNNFDLASLVSSALENANNNNSDLAARSMNNSAYLAEVLTEKALNNAVDVNTDATGQLVRGFESMMGFADQYSRSDGTVLAKSNNETVLYAVGGLSVVAITVALIMRSKAA